MMSYGAFQMHESRKTGEDLFIAGFLNINLSFSSDPADPENFPGSLTPRRSPVNIMSHILILKGNPLRRLIGFLSGFLQVFSGCGHTEDTATVCDDLAFVVEFCSGVEDIIVVFSLELLKSFDQESFLYSTG